MADNGKKRRRTARRASRSASKGGGGVSAVKATFELELDWASVENTPSGDLGTDLFVLVRDRRLFDLGLVMGAQVKTGSKGAFQYPTKGDDPAGWWFRDRDKSHTDYWLTHQLPHVVIFHDEARHVSYWAHVSAESVMDTGKGSKILVPEANTLDANHLDELLAVAGSGREPISFEGSAWTGATPAASLDLLRFALLVPRLIAPHPNAGHQEQLSAPQAAALLMQARYSEYQRYAETLDDVPTLEDALTDNRWAWRFVGALGKCMFKGEPEPMRSLIDGAPDAAAGAAATVVVASTLIARAEPRAALEALDAALAHDDAPPVDHAWLLLQRARALVELGQVEEARVAAVEVQAVRTTAGQDVSATAITGVAAMILFNTADWQRRDVGEVIVGADTVAAWWRNQTISRGATAVVERTFKEWAADQTTTVGGADEANNQLFVAALNAGYLGDQASWRRLTSLLGQDSLLRLGRHSDVDAVASGLHLLRLAGDKKALKLAIARVSEDGPAEAVTQAATEVSLEDSTRTTILADLTFVQAGGDLFERQHAEAASRWIVAALDDPSQFLSLSTTHFGDVQAELIETFVGLVGVVPEVGVQLVHDRLATVTDEQETLRTQAWGKLLRAIPEQAWTAEDVSALQPSDALAGDVRTVALGVSATQRAEAQQELVQQVRAGSLSALAALKSVADLDGDTVKALLDRLRVSLDEDRRSVREGTLGFGRYDAAECVALLLSFHSHSAATTALLKYLDDPCIPRASKRQAFIALARNRDLLKGRLRERIAAVASRAEANEAPLDSSPFGNPDIAGPAGFLAATLSDDPSEAARRFFTLLSGPTVHRAWAASIAAASGGELAAVIPAMIEDQHPQVRQAAAGQLAQLLRDGSRSPAVGAALHSAAADPGRVVPLVIAGTLAYPGVPLSSELCSLLQTLAQHASAMVRAKAVHALSQ